jgi:hypothetical protein
VQIPEPVSKELKNRSFEYVDQVTRQRIRNVIEGYSIKSKKIPKRKGTFTSVHLGKAINGQDILEGKDLPSRQVLAPYLLFTIEGQSMQIPKANRVGFIGESDSRGYYLHYEASPEWFESQESYLTLQQIEEISLDAKNRGKEAFVMAPACFVNREDMPKNITFHALPYEIQRFAFSGDEA